MSSTDDWIGSRHLLQYQYETVQASTTRRSSIFIRVNSKGRPLKATDLALASLSARWAGAVGRIEGLAAVLASKQFGHLDVQFLVRALAALTTQQGGLGGLSKASIEDLDEAWVRLEEGLTRSPSQACWNHLVQAHRIRYLSDPGGRLPRFDRQRLRRQANSSG
jgi:hypothetical protein